MSENARLLYLDAGDIDDDRTDFDGLNVLDTAGQKLGDVDGFIVHRDTKRPYYVVVDSGGWFSSRSFLVPIGHARLDADNQALRVDLDRNTIERFPRFDEDRFEEMSEAEARLFNEETLRACCPSESKARAGADRYDDDRWTHYAQPDWWRSTWFTSAPSGTSTARAAAVGSSRPADVAPPRADVRPRGERVIARDRDLGDADIDIDRARDERDVRDVIDPLDRAQPGDVLGVETGGETTALGDTARDERRRVEDAEEDAAKQRRDESRDRDRR